MQDDEPKPRNVAGKQEIVFTSSQKPPALDHSALK